MAIKNKLQLNLFYENNLCIKQYTHLYFNNL